MFFAEEECSSDREVTAVNTLFLTNRKCPWRCVMCDLWKHTLTESVTAGAIPAQIDYALSRLPDARVVKLYNSGSFFDPRAIPVADYEQIASRIDRFERVIVECHPALIGERCLQFRNLLKGRLEIAMGLETAHPEVLRRLNKGMTLEQFSAAAGFLRQNEIDLRVFILVRPPFLDENEALYWAKRSLDFAFECGATAASLIPTRGGNSELDALAASGDFTPPRIETLEAAHEYGLNLHMGRVFSDLWDLERFSRCATCWQARRDRLSEMNLRQTILPAIGCSVCGNRA
jgi:radical SAM enzyme (TIGR01210 family)